MLTSRLRSEDSRYENRLIDRLKMKTLTFLILMLFVSAVSNAEAEQPVHLFILSGQSNMAGMDPETGFMTEANKLFGDDTVVYIKVAKGGQPICRWLKEWKRSLPRPGWTKTIGNKSTKVGRSSSTSPSSISMRSC